MIVIVFNLEPSCLATLPFHWGVCQVFEVLTLINMDWKPFDVL